MFSKNDIVLLTETWLGEEASVQVNGFKHFQLNRTLRKRNAKRDSGGIIAYIRDELVTDTTLFMLDNDDLIWLRFDGDLFNLTDDLFLCLCYNVPIGSSRQGLLDSVDIFDRLSDQVVQINNLTDNKCNFIVCGDFNARTADFPDYVIDDSADHMHVLPEDYLTDLPLKRVSEDKGYNRYGSELLDFCKQTGLRILNGRVGADIDIGKYTYVGSTGKSLVDYVIASQSLFSSMHAFSVDEPNILSDHCIVNFSLLSSENVDEYDQNVADPDSFLTYKYVWDSNNVEAYQSALDSDDITVKISNLQSDINSGIFGRFEFKS